MNQHWRLAAGGSITVVVVALPLAAMIGAYVGGLEAWSFLYGVGVGLPTFASIALAVSLILCRTTELKLMIGAGVYVGRLVIAAGAMLLPALFVVEWPIMPMVGGFVLVYVVENMALLWGAWKTASTTGARRSGTEG